MGDDRLERAGRSGKSEQAVFSDPPAAITGGLLSFLQTFLYLVYKRRHGKMPNFIYISSEKVEKN